MRKLVLLTLLVAASHVAVSAQETTGTITGSATDQTGAALPGVTVTVKNRQRWRHANDRHQRSRTLYGDIAASRQL